jgi:hypothetical protein
MLSTPQEMVSVIKKNHNLVTLPCRNELTKRLSAAEFSRFNKMTHLDEALAGQSLSPIAIALVVEAAICDYMEHILYTRPRYFSRPQKDKLLETILRDYPDALRMLRHYEFLKPFADKKTMQQ